MSYLNKMYGKKITQESNKNPNRVMGGLKAQGVDSVTVLGEHGELIVPSQRYVQGLRDKIRVQDARINKIENSIRQLQR